MRAQIWMQNQGEITHLGLVFALETEKMTKLLTDAYLFNLTMRVIMGCAAALLS